MRRQKCRMLTDSFILTNTHQPEANCEHPCMHSKCYSFSRVLKLCIAAAWQRGCHEKREGPRTERIARCPILNHRVGIYEIFCKFTGSGEDRKC
jgi:hypothetical protein